MEIGWTEQFYRSIWVKCEGNCFILLLLNDFNKSAEGKLEWIHGRNFYFFPICFIDAVGILIGWMHCSVGTDF